MVGKNHGHEHTSGVGGLLDLERCRELGFKFIGVCSWCGSLKVDASLTLHVIEESGSGVLLGFSFGYCCMGCAWAWGLRSECELHGADRASAMEHLIREHSLKPCVPGGAETVECKAWFLRKRIELDVLFLRLKRCDCGGL